MKTRTRPRIRPSIISKPTSPNIPRPTSIISKPTPIIPRPAFHIGRNIRFNNHMFELQHLDQDQDPDPDL